MRTRLCFDIKLPGRSRMSIRFNSTQSATNNSTHDDFSSYWNAELFVHRFDISESYPKLKKAFPDLPDCMQPHHHVILAKANYWIVSMERLYKAYGLDSDAFLNVMLSVDPLAELLEIMDMDNPGTFKIMREEDEETEQERMLNEFGPQENIILISRVEVNKNVRGHQLGRNLVQRILDNFGGAECRVILKPWPLQWNGRRAPETQKRIQQFERDRSKVISVWESMGLEQIGDTQFWGRCQGNRHPMEIFD